MSAARLVITEEDALRALADPTLSSTAQWLLEKLWAAGGLLPDQLLLVSPDLQGVDTVELDLHDERLMRYDRVLDQLGARGYVVVSSSDDSLVALPVACWGQAWSA